MIGYDHYLCDGYDPNDGDEPDELDPVAACEKCRAAVARGDGLCERCETQRLYGREGDEPDDESVPSCPACCGDGVLLGNVTHYRCRNCGQEA